MMTDGWGLFAALSCSLLMGAGFGALYLALVWRSARRLTETRGGAGQLVLGFTLRLALILVVLALAILAGAGAPHLLAGLLGFTFVRQAALRRKVHKE